MNPPTRSFCFIAKYLSPALWNACMPSSVAGGESTLMLESFHVYPLTRGSESSKVRQKHEFQETTKGELHLMKWLLVLVALFAMVASAADVNGTWKASIETPNGNFEQTFTFKADGNKLTGKVSS